MYNEIVALRNEKKAKKKENEKILKQKDDLETNCRKMQEETENLENVYKELLLLSNEFKVIKRNEVPSAFEGAWQSPTNGRTASDTMSAMSMDMMMDVPDDVDEEEQGNGLGSDQFVDNSGLARARIDTITLDQTRRGSVRSDGLENVVVPNSSKDSRMRDKM
jgi:hypothetical protein